MLMVFALNFLNFANYSDINVLAIQESKLRRTTVQKYRNNILGGRLLLFIRTDIVFEKLHSFEKSGMEILSIRLKTTKST